MALNARVITLKSSARLSADLAFGDTGMIEDVEHAVGLGAQIPAYSPRSSLYGRLGELEVGPDAKPTGRLVFDSSRLRAELLPKAVFVLENEAAAAELDQAILARQNEWFTLYRHVDDVFVEIDKTSRSKLASLTLLRSLVDDYHDQVEKAYSDEEAQNDPQKLIDNPKHDPAIRPTTINTIKLSGVGTVEKGSDMQHDGKGFDGPVPWTHELQHSVYVAGKKTSTGAWETYTDAEPTLVAQQITSIVQSDGITHPRLENHMRHERMAADLSDELLAARVYSMRVPYLKQIWKNELDGIDLEIRKLQLAYIGTFLFSSFDGRVTAFYKQRGDRAKLGDPVARVEDDSALLLFGQVVCASAPVVGQPVKIVTKQVYGDNASPTLTLSGNVVLVRGVDSLAGRWNVTFDVANGGAVKVPAGYEFDPDPKYTTVTIG